MKDMTKIQQGHKQYFNNLKQTSIAKYLTILRGYNNQSLIYYIAGLYDGEGTKTGTVFTLTNSDVKMLKTFLLFGIEVLGLSKEELRSYLFTTTTMNQDECKSYWEAELGLKVTPIVPDKRVPKRTRDNYKGTIQITFPKANGLREALRLYSDELTNGIEPFGNTIAQAM